MSRLGVLPLVVGVVLGVVLGLVYAWLISPVEYVNTSPALLRNDYRHEWVRLAALSYLADGDLERAQARLSAIPAEDVQSSMAALIETYAAQGRPAPTMRALSRLAEQLGVRTPAMLVYLGTPPASTPIVVASPTPTPVPPQPTFTPTPTPSLPRPPYSPLPPPVSGYRAISQTLSCEGPAGQLRVWVRRTPPEEEGRRIRPTPTPLPGVHLWLTWSGGADRAVTGMRPQMGPGYADFTLQPDVTYALSVDEPNAPVLSNLTLSLCPETGEWGSLEVIVERVE